MPEYRAYVVPDVPESGEYGKRKTYVLRTQADYFRASHQTRHSEPLYVVTAKKHHVLNWLRSGCDCESLDDFVGRIEEALEGEGTSPEEVLRILKELASREHFKVKEFAPLKKS